MMVCASDGPYCILQQTIGAPLTDKRMMGKQTKRTSNQRTMVNGTRVFRYYSIEQSICLFFVIWTQWEWRAVLISLLLHFVTMCLTIAAASAKWRRNRVAMLVMMRLTPVAVLVIIVFKFSCSLITLFGSSFASNGTCQAKYTNLHTSDSHKTKFAVESIS